MENTKNLLEKVASENQGNSDAYILEKDRYIVELQWALSEYENVDISISQLEIVITDFLSGILENLFDGDCACVFLKGFGTFHKNANGKLEFLRDDTKTDDAKDIQNIIDNHNATV